MFSVVNTATIFGIDSKLVSVEADISDGMPLFEMVGCLSGEVKEAKERVRAALKNEGYCLPIKRITINLSPANIKKTGSGFDLPIAIAILSAIGIIQSQSLDDICIIGEISLTGAIQPINGVLSMVLEAREKGKSICIVPMKNINEARLVPNITVIGVNKLKDVIDFLNEGTIAEQEVEGAPIDDSDEVQFGDYDFSMINGQPQLRRACEVAISGMHNLLMVGSPGAGKSFVAKCIPSILPPLNKDEQIELSKIYSVCGKFDERKGLIKKRPFRAPHHTVSEYGLTGGGSNPKPGEISLAHSGVLFLDELTEFQKKTIEVLRQPLEDKSVTISRVNGSYTFPANVVLVAAMNPCSCGYYPDLNRCHCSKASISRYIGKISQPLLDRIDICVEAPTVNFTDIISEQKNESSETIRLRVVRCHQLQNERYKNESFNFNSDIPADKIDKYCSLDAAGVSFMKDAYEKYQLTARTYHKILRVARTIADMQGNSNISIENLQEALIYKNLDKKFWEEHI